MPVLAVKASTIFCVAATRSALSSAVQKVIEPPDAAGEPPVLEAGSLAGALVAALAGADARMPNRSSAWNGSTAIVFMQNLVVLDIRSAIDGGGAQAYAAAHIPGSVHSDYDKAGWRVTRNNVPFMVPTVPELEKLIGDLGIDETSHVVVVPAGVNVLDFGSAARTYWNFEHQSA